ncbi:putative ATP-grasp-modified RiPP [Streptacidiphilus sp. P02-A3a]|uniref:putative ATP-grasp-modified RiPP n=1 Tax=Streptacidiphilus sp. P02-A3a TaxID=2704468 RepID=UPI0015FBD717|nr:putative ATP-grasp-modified RiPP [Streptacidiphilus sp. P02-A3a]QMU70926.1 putative ATP-grasp-modified RiPP [Streptacidiphilus sp. P02-A3a]
MFGHAERFPTGDPLPQGQVTPAPWVVGRIAPYPPFEAASYSRVELDPATRTAHCFAMDGTPMMRPTGDPGHGTSSGTNPGTGSGAVRRR